MKPDDLYLMWQRAKDTAQEQINEAETTIVLNSELVKLAKQKLKTLPKPNIDSAG